MNIYYHTLVLEYDSHVVVKELLELLIAEVDAELLKPNVINFIINGHFDADLLKPVECEDLEAGDVKDADEYSFFLRGESGMGVKNLKMVTMVSSTKVSLQRSTK